METQNKILSAEISEISEIILLCVEKQALKKAVFSKPQNPSFLKMVMTMRKIGKDTVLQAEYFHKDNKATHENIAKADAPEKLYEIASRFAQVNVISSAGECELRRSKSGKVTLINGAKLKRALGDDNVAAVEVQSNNIKKKHILSGDEPFLKLLGISDANGRIYDKKQLKFRQINRFVEMIRDIEHELPKDEIFIADLCCGKSYLSFAVYHYFANVLGLKTKMVGVDLKPDVVAYCSEVAQKLDFSGLSFVCGNILNYESERAPDLVVSLHACDTATDIVLEKALLWESKVILATPCCHHELNHTLNCPTLSFIAEHSMLRQKFCDAATDALRLKLLQSRGYRTAALELVEDAPKNILLRAIKVKGADLSANPYKKYAEEYETAKAFLLNLK